MGDMFSSAWETRHGAASGLREVIKLHGRGAGKSMDTPSDQVSNCLFTLEQLPVQINDLGLTSTEDMDRPGHLCPVGFVNGPFLI